MSSWLSAISLLCAGTRAGLHRARTGGASTCDVQAGQHCVTSCGVQEQHYHAVLVVLSVPVCSQQHLPLHNDLTCHTLHVRQTMIKRCMQIWKQALLMVCEQTTSGCEDIYMPDGPITLLVQLPFRHVAELQSFDKALQSSACTALTSISNCHTLS